MMKRNMEMMHLREWVAETSVLKKKSKYYVSSS